MGRHRPLPLSCRPGAGQNHLIPAATPPAVADSPLPEETHKRLDKVTKQKRGKAAVLLERNTVLRRRLIRDLEGKEKRKKSKKELDAYKKWRGQEAPRQLNSYIRGLRDNAQKKFGSRAIALANEMDSLAVGIPCPFAFEYLLQQNVLPLGVVMSLVAPPACCKTALLAEIQSWFQKVAGLGITAKNESKISPDLGPSLLGYDETSVIEHKTDSTEGWQESLTYWIEKIQQMCVGTKEQPGPGRTVPVCFGVDSISAKLARASQADISKQGFASRAHPLEALLNTRYMKFIPQQIEDWPFLLVLVNQLKKSKVQVGGTMQDKRDLAGGWQILFQECFEIESVILKRQSNWLDPGLGEMFAKTIQLRCQKNSQGEDCRRVSTRMAWWYEKDPATDMKRQRTQFQWGWSLVDLLAGAAGHVRKSIEEVLDLNIVARGDAENAAWSARLGVDSKHPVSWEELGQRIQQDPHVIQGLREVYNIKDRGVLQSAVDFMEQKAIQAAKLTL